MESETSLSPEAAEDLRHIADELEEYVCLECGVLNPRTAEKCISCGAQMRVPWGDLSESYVAALDLVRSGQLDPNQTRELLDNLQMVQSFYTAGTRYSVFG